MLASRGVAAYERGMSARKKRTIFFIVVRVKNIVRDELACPERIGGMCDHGEDGEASQ